MNKQKYLITKKYELRQGDSATVEPINEPTPQQLFGWLVSRGVSGNEANEIIKRVDEEEEITITL